MLFGFGEGHTHAFRVNQPPMAIAQKNKKKGHYPRAIAYCRKYSPNRGLIVITNVGWVFFFFLKFYF
jgi:hypothetical protein